MNKSNIVIYSEVFSMTTSFLIGILTYIPYNRLFFMKVTTLISLSKSFNLINCSKFEYFHHILNGLLCIYFFTGTYKLNINFEDYHLLNDYYSVVRPNISTFFLLLRYYYKNVIIDLLFFMSFFYYRSLFIYHVFKGMPGIKLYVCNNNPLIANYSCVLLFDVCYLLLVLLNIYWGFLIIRKFKKYFKFKKYLSLKNISSILIAIPILYPFKEYNYYEISIFILMIVSFLYHISICTNYFNSNYKQYFYYLDSFAVINCCLSRILDPLYCLVISILSFRNLKIRNAIYICSAICTYIDADIQDKYILLSLYLSILLCFLNINKNNWTNTNSLIWHFLNSLYIWIGGKYKK